LLKCRSILEKPIDPCLFEPLPSFAFGALCFELASPFFLFELCFPFNMPLMVTDSTLSMLELSSQNKFDCNLSNTSFKLTGIIVLPSNSLGL
jgi:hypothetical protein